MEWLLLALFSVFLFAIAILMQRKIMKESESDPVAYSMIFELTCGVLIFAYLFITGFTMPPIASLPINFALTGILYGFGGIYIFKSLKLIEASSYNIFAATRVLWTVGTSIIFLGESVTPVRIAGAFLVLFAILIASWEKQKLSLNKGSLYALFAAFLYGLAFTNDFFILNQSEAISYTAFAFLLPGIVIFLYKPSSVGNAYKFIKSKAMKHMLLLCTIFSISAISIYKAYQLSGMASQIAPISQSVTIITVILAAIFLGERGNLFRKIIAALVVTAGVLLVL